MHFMDYFMKKTFQKNEYMKNGWLHYQEGKFPSSASPPSIVKGKSFGEGDT